MRIVFVLDNNEYVDAAPEQLQFRQLQEGLAALGIEVVIPIRRKCESTDLDEHAPNVEVGFRPLINYGVNLSIPSITTTTHSMEPLPPLPKERKFLRSAQGPVSHSASTVLDSSSSRPFFPLRAERTLSILRSAFASRLH
jgi:hypothetical protein